MSFITKKPLNLSKINGNQKFLDSAYLNDSTYMDYLNRMEQICESMFEWVNLPESMDSRYLEQCLYYNGQASLLYDKKYGFINTKCADGGYLNIYELPTQLHCYSQQYSADRLVYSGLPTDVLTDQCVLVLNNWERIPTNNTIQLFAYRMYLAQRSCDVNVMATRTPVLILGTDKQKLTLENLYNKYDGNQPFIFGDKDIISNDMMKAIAKIQSLYSTYFEKDYKEMMSDYGREDFDSYTYDGFQMFSGDLLMLGLTYFEHGYRNNEVLHQIIEHIRTQYPNQLNLFPPEFVEQFKIKSND